MKNEISFNKEELQILSEKLSEFGDSLSEKERSILNLILARAKGNAKLEKSKATSTFSDNKDAIMNLAKAIEGKESVQPDGGWGYVSWTYHF